MLNQKRPNPIDAKKIKREEDHRNQSNNSCVPYLVGCRPRYTPHFRANVAQKLLDRWVTGQPKFVKVIPRDYKQVLAAIRRARETGVPEEQAVMEAAHG